MKGPRLSVPTKKERDENKHVKRSGFYQTVEKNCRITTTDWRETKYRKARVVNHEWNPWLSSGATRESEIDAHGY